MGSRKKLDNDYLDECWGSCEDKGASLLQKRIAWLVGKLRYEGEKLREVCASNLIFKRSAGSRDAGYPQLADVCWPVHRAVLEIVRLSVVLAFGSHVIDYLTRRFGGERPEQFPSGHSNWQCRSAVF